MTFSEEIVSLQRAAHDLMYLGMDGNPVYSDDLSRRNGEVYRLTTALYNSGVKGSTVEEQANVCLALLMGYNATIYDYGDKGQKKQAVLDRIYNVLEKLPDSLLKVRLLTYTYGEVYEESMLQEAHDIISNWNKSALTIEQMEVIEELKNIEENPYPFEVI